MTTNRTAAIATYEAAMAAAYQLDNITDRRLAIKAARKAAAEALGCRTWELPSTSFERAARSGDVI